MKHGIQELPEHFSHVEFEIYYCQCVSNNAHECLRQQSYHLQTLLKLRFELRKRVPFPDYRQSTLGNSAVGRMVATTTVSHLRKKCISDLCLVLFYILFLKNTALQNTSLVLKGSVYFFDKAKKVG